jgi:hypothetical protein
MPWPFCSWLPMLKGGPPSRVLAVRSLRNVAGGQNGDREHFDLGEGECAG